MFADRTDAGRCLAARLEHLYEKDVVVLGLPRGGVPVAYEVAKVLAAPLDVLVVRKLGAPFQPELAVGAIGEGGVRVLNDELVRLTGVSETELAEVEQHERAELERRVRRFRPGRSRVNLVGRTAIVVDDGIATGSTARAACQVARAEGAARVVLAVPVAPPGWEEGIGSDADEFVCLETPAAFFAIGQFYDDFRQTSDEEVLACLDYAAQSALAGATSASGDDPPLRDEDVAVPAGPVLLGGRLTLPEDAREVVVFAHGSGSSRHSPRNRYVASILNEAGLGTLLFDLLTPEEELDRANVFDVVLLASRLVEVSRWLRGEPGLAHLPISYFGASTGAAAALWAAAEEGADVTAVVARGGRPDLAGARLPDVVAPTLLIVGGDDDDVLELNEKAQDRLRCENRLVVVPGATHLFEEPGTLQAVAEAATEWFTSHLPTGE